MASSSSCDHVSFPKESLLIAHVKQSRKLGDTFSLSFQSWHAVAAPAWCLVCCRRNAHPAPCLSPRCSPHRCGMIAFTWIPRSCFQAELHSKIRYSEDLCSAAERLRLHQSQDYSECLSYNLWLKSRLSSGQLHVLAPASVW